MSALFLNCIFVYAAFNTNSESGFNIEYDPSIDFTAANVNDILDNISNLTEIVFDYDNGTNYQTIKTNGIHIAEFKNGEVIIDLYTVATDTDTTAYMISESNIIAPTSCSSMFSSLTTVEKITFNNFNTIQVTNMSNIFAGCSGLTELNLSNFITNRVKYMSYMFNNCQNLESLSLSSFNTDVVENMIGMFAGCVSLGELDLSNFNTSRLTSMFNMFAGCEGLKSLNISNFNTINVTTMSGMFANCKSLGILNLSSFNTIKVANMSGMFANCSSLRAIGVTELFKTDNVTSSSDMFFNCIRLRGGNGTSVNISFVDKSYAIIDGYHGNYGYLTGTNSQWSSRHVTEYDEFIMNFIKYGNETGAGESQRIINHITFDYNVPESCSLLSSSGTVKVYYNDTSKHIYFISNYTIVFRDASCTFFSGLSTLQTITLTNFYTGLATSMAGMFSDCTSLTEITITDKFITSSVTDMSEMFKNCASLSEDILNPVLEKLDTSNVRNMASMFFCCGNENLEILDLSSFNTQKVTDMSSMFNSCVNLTAIMFGDNFNTGNVTTMHAMFKSCQKIRSIALDGTGNPLYTCTFDTANVTDMSFMFYDCTVLEALGLKSFDIGNVTTLEAMFAWCSNMEIIIVSADNWQYNGSVDDDNMYYMCKVQGVTYE